MDRFDSSLLILRMVFGLFLAYHGVNKLKNGLAGTAGWFASIGMKWPAVQAVTAATTEITAGILLAVGLATPLACAAVIATMTVAIVTVHRRVGFFIFLPNGGWEYCASIIAVAAAVSLGGPGAISLDNAVGWHFTTTAGVTSIGVGFGLAMAHLMASYRPRGS